jgi:hypothetical protein
MPRDGAFLLSEYAAETVRVTCRCGRNGEFDKQALIKGSGRGEKLPVLRLKLAARMGGEIAARALASETERAIEQCQMIYPGPRRSAPLG